MRLIFIALDLKDIITKPDVRQATKTALFKAHKLRTSGLELSLFYKVQS